MLDQTPGRYERQITSAAAENPALTGIPESASPTPLVDIQAPEDKPDEPKRETSLLGEFLRLACGTAGFLMGGPAGAAIGSAVGQLTGELATKQTRMVWPTLARAFLSPKGIGRKEIVLIIIAMTVAIPTGVDAHAAKARAQAHLKVSGSLHHPAQSPAEREPEIAAVHLNREHAVAKAGADDR